MKIAVLGVKAVPCAGGIAAYTQHLSSRLVARGHEVTVYCRRQYLGDEFTGGRLPDFEGIRRRLSPGLRGKHLDALTHTLTAALDTLRRQYDLVHIHGSAPAAVAPLLRCRPGRPVVVTIHSRDWEGEKWGPSATRAMRLGARIPARFAQEVTVVSRRLQQFYREVHHRETTYIPTGIELPQLPAPDQITRRWGLRSGEYLLFVGRLTPEKGLEYLLEAYQKLDTDKKLVIVGPADLRDPYVDRVKQYASDEVIFTGYLRGPVLAELFGHCYLYVQPSTLEGMPIAVLEALSYGRCVLASDIPGNREALQECGYTFQTGDSADLHDKLTMLLEDEERVKAEFAPVRRYVQREHDWDKTTDEFERLYEQLI